jgi:hypothetical protein
MIVMLHSGWVARHAVGMLQPIPMVLGAAEERVNPCGGRLLRKKHRGIDSPRDTLPDPRSTRVGEGAMRRDPLAHIYSTPESPRRRGASDPHVS